MARGKPRYYVVRRGRAFWQPKASMRALGFRSVPLGRDGPDAFKQAEEWNRRWEVTRRGDAPSPAMIADNKNLSPERAEELTVYPRGSLGEAFKRYRRTPEWGRKAPRTREDWWRGWKRIKPIFGDLAPRTITLEGVSEFRQMVEETAGLREAHRALKIWRALWQVAGSLGYCRKDADPSFGVRNTAAPGRKAKWVEGEAARLAKRAWRMRYYGLAALMATAWDTQLGPGDTRALLASQMASGREGEAFFTERDKTGEPVGGVLSRRTLKVIAAYLDRLGVELHGDAPIFRNRSGRPYSKDTLGGDFNHVRRAEFGPGEKRTLHDFRRSGAVEAIAGKAEPAEVAHAMGNTLASSNSLFATYVPVNVATLRSVAEARLRGRTKLRS